MPKAIFLLRRKRYCDDGSLSEVVLCQLPNPVPGPSHRFKYSLFFGYPGRPAVAYDNERGIGHHRHLDDREEAYQFVALDKLLADFEADVDVFRGMEKPDG